MQDNTNNVQDPKNSPSEDQVRVHEETLANDCRIRVTVTPVNDATPQRPQWQVEVFSPAGESIHDETARAKDDHWTVEKLCNWGIDQAKRVAGGYHGAPLDDHHQATPV